MKIPEHLVFQFNTFHSTDENACLESACQHGTTHREQARIATTANGVDKLNAFESGVVLRKRPLKVTALIHYDPVSNRRPRLCDLQANHRRDCRVAAEYHLCAVFNDDHRQSTNAVANCNYIRGIKVNAMARGERNTC